MICSKCNSEISNGSRFCPVCGAECSAAAPAAAEQKNVCSKCGQELNVGAKFCPSCGAAASADSAVSLNKEPNANDLVATMNAAAAAVPNASEPTSAPAFSGVPTPTAPAAGYNSGFSTPTAGAAPTMPQAPAYAPYGNNAMPPMGGVAFNGMNGAAVVAAPAKKKVSAGKIVLIIAIVLVLLIGGAVVFFFTNKATAMSILMGKPKYAAMVEKDSLKKATENLDMDAISEQIKSASGVVSTLAGLNTVSIDDFNYLGVSANADREIAQLMSISPEPVFDGVDIKSMIKEYNKLMQSTYGMNRISGSMSAKVKIGPKFEDYDDEDLNMALDFINNCEFTYDLASTEKLMGTEFGVKLNGKTIDAKIIIEDDGSAYILFPFATDKALKYKIATVENSSATQAASIELDLDSKEIERLIDEIIDIYTGYIKNSSVTMEKGSINVAGNLVEGKEIIADINGKNLENLFKEVFEHIANDKYFSGKVVEFIKYIDEDFTESDYKDAIKDIVKDMSDITEDDKLIVTMIVNNSGKLLAKSYTVAAGGQQYGTIAFADSDTVSAADIKVLGQSVASVTNEKTSDKDGKVTVKVGYGPMGSLSMILEYAGVDTADFGKTKVPVGTYTLKFDVSKASSLGIDEETMEILKSFVLKFSTNVSGNKANCSFTLGVRDYIDLDISADMALSDDVSKFSVPSNVIDLTPMIEGEDLNDAAMETLMNYFEELGNGLSNTVKGTMLEDIFEDIIYHITPSNFEQPVIEPNRPVEESTNSGTYYDDVTDLYKRLEDEAEEFFALVESYDWYELVDSDPDMLDDFEKSEAYKVTINYVEKMSELAEELYNVDGATCTKEQLDSFNKQFSDIIKQKDAVKKALDCYYPSQLTGMGPAA